MKGTVLILIGVLISSCYFVAADNIGNQNYPTAYNSGGPSGAYDYLIFTFENATDTYYAAKDSFGRVVDSWTSTDAATTLNTTFAQGGVIYISEGIYVNTFTPSIRVAGTTVKGAGIHSTILTIPDNVTHNVLGINGTYGVTVSDLQINGNAENNNEQTNLDTSLNGLKLTYCTNCTIQNIYVTNVYEHGISLFHTSFTTIENCRVINSGSRKVGDTYVSQSGILLHQECHHNIIKKNYVANITSKGIYVSQNCWSNTIIANDITNMREVISTGRAIHFTSANCSYNNIIANNIDNCRQAIYFDGSDATGEATWNVIQNNMITRIPESAITIINSTYTSIKSNTINNTPVAVSISGTSDRSSITGNTIFTSGVAIQISSQRILISGNWIHGFPTTIGELTGANLNVITANYLEGNITRIGSLTQVYGNKAPSATAGTITENMVTATNTTATTFVITTGVSGPVTYADFDFDATTLAVADFKYLGYSQSSTTQITVTVSGTGLPATMTVKANMVYKP